MFSSKVYLIFIFILINSTLTFGQSSSIAGYVFDAQTHKPIINTNIYIVNTTIGTVTDKKGFFKLHSLQNGKYRIIFSHVSYHYQVVELKVLNSSTHFYQIELQPKLYELPQVMVESKKDNRWLKNYKTFEREILGYTNNAESAKILNKYEITFEEKGGDTLFAFSRKPIEIDNEALGYKITYFLEYFEHFLESTKYAGFPVFTELTPVSDVQKNVWKENRLRTYCSSFRHFVRAICSNKTHSQDSVFINAVKIDSAEYEYNFDYDPKMYLSKHGFKVFQLQELPWESDFNKPILNVVNVNTLLSQSIVSNEFSLSSDYILQVVYTKELDKTTNVTHTFKNPSKEQISWIKLVADTVNLDIYGRYWDEFKIQTYGFFSYQRVADLLPFDYFPTDSTIFSIDSFDKNSIRNSSSSSQ